MDQEIIIIGNKSDRINDIEVDQDEVDQLAEDYGVPHFISSAKNGKNLDEAISKLLENIIKNQDLERKIKKHKESYRLGGDVDGAKRKRLQKKKTMCA